AVVHEGGDSLDTAVERALQRSSETGATFCHPFDDVDVIAGQGTLGLELVEQIPDLRTIVIPLGGGGLAAGTAIAVKSQLPNVRVVGVQVAACSPYVTGVSPTGPIQTLADGIAVKKPGTITRPLIKQWLDDILVVQEDSVGEAMTLLLERSKLLVEGGGAVGVAALLAGLLPPVTSGTTCIVLSGGNMDLSTLSGLVRRFETRRGRRAVLLVRISDRPGGLAGLLSIVADAGANVIDLEHLRDGVDLHVRETAVNLVLEVKNSEHCSNVVAELEQAGYIVKKLSD
ncbi:MAG: pyridoxal-phosphate dependent enzyme, partial [Ilumatobacteraceae bacterium]